MCQFCITPHKSDQEERPGFSKHDRAGLHGRRRRRTSTSWSSSPWSLFHSGTLSSVGEMLSQPVKWWKYLKTKHVSIQSPGQRWHCGADWGQGHRIPCNKTQPWQKVDLCEDQKISGERNHWKSENRPSREAGVRELPSLETGRRLDEFNVRYINHTSGTCLESTSMLDSQPT